MTYYSVSFIFFSAFVLLFFAQVKPTFKIWCLFIASALWYYLWGKLGFLILFTILISNLITLRFIKRSNAGHVSRLFFGLCTLNIFILLTLKMLPEIIPGTTTPYGTSFFMLMILGVIIDCWRDPKKLEMCDNASFLAMPIFFPLLMAGPIERSGSFFPQIKRSHVSIDNLSSGILIFSIGFLKKLYIANPLEDALFLKVHSGNIFIDGLFNTFLTYVVFSSYCDMGRGIARVFGIELTVNFKAFYYSKNPNEFWQRWNITLGTWIRDYLTFPLMLRFGRKISPNVIIIFSFIFIGLWHGISLNWFVFGLFNGLIIFLYNVLNRIFTGRIHGYFLVVCIWIGNGIFQHKNFVNSFNGNFSWIPIFDFSRINLTTMIISLIALFCYEYIQEKKKDTDVILKLPKNLKYTFAIILVVLFLYALSLNAFISVEDNLPVYFKI